MAQRCSYCGRTKKQHKGVACLDLSKLALQLRAIKESDRAGKDKP